MENTEFKLGAVSLIERLPGVRKPHPTIPKYYLYCYYGLFKCFCGKEFTTALHKIKSGHTKSCGCYNKQRVKETLGKGGRAGTRLYRIYKGMKQRCNNPKNPNYYRYGGKGVKICDAWKDYDIFKKWAFENGYTENLTIDRKKSDQNYSPENCRWITQAEQAINKPHGLFYKTPYKGAFKIRYKWYTFIQRNKIRHVYGGFDTPEDAGYIYNIAAAKYHKELAAFNKLPEGYVYKGKPISELEVF